MDMPIPPARWKPVHSSDAVRWFHTAENSEINFHPNGSITFAVQGGHLRMANLTLTGDEQEWIAVHRAWLLTQPDAKVS